MAEKTDITRESPPRMIEQDIARTREEMSGTVSEIQQRLSAARIKEEAKQRIRRTAQDTASRIGETAREAASALGESAKSAGSSILNVVKTYPVPIAMLGIGVTWLMFTRSTAGNGGTMESTSEKAQAKAQELSGTVKEKAGEISEKAQATAEQLSGQVREKGTRLVGKAKESAQRFGRAARQQAWGAKNRMQQWIDENPLGITVAAFGVGILIGFIIPESRKEKELMGTASESLLSRAKETAQKTIQKAQYAAERAVQTAEEEFKKTA